MAKSKEQKQLEAIQRKRQHLVFQRQVYLEAQYGTQTYNKKLQVMSQEKLDLQAAEAKRIFLKACKEAQVDIHGNPLPGSPGYEEPGLLLDPDAMVKVNREPVFSSGSFDQIKHNVEFDGDEPMISLLNYEQAQKEINRLREAAILLRKAPYFNPEKAKRFEAEATRIEKLL